MWIKEYWPTFDNVECMSFGRLCTGWSETLMLPKISKAYHTKYHHCTNDDNALLDQHTGNPPQ
jgi:hypothetical protein